MSGRRSRPSPRSPPRGRRTRRPRSARATAPRSSPPVPRGWRPAAPPRRRATALRVELLHPRERRDRRAEVRDRGQLLEAARREPEGLDRRGRAVAGEEREVGARRDDQRVARARLRGRGGEPRADAGRRRRCRPGTARRAPRLVARRRVVSPRHARRRDRQRVEDGVAGEAERRATASSRRRTGSSPPRRRRDIGAAGGRELGDEHERAAVPLVDLRGQRRLRVGRACRG